ncbi:unnamed protein product [Blepharisma stoltei]|uniref:Uncharacterized protein n=1 Tax=Blepharisma stoltei TaxID=1481888 RepID=A0AAU9JSN7_9CILI|nr:unnamed protein product [Blepharisma stoltei]
MGQSHSKKPQWPSSLDLIDFRRQIQAGDLILISTSVPLETDMKIPPTLLHCIEYNLHNRTSVSTHRNFPVWDSAGIVVDMALGDNDKGGKCILELTQNGFVESEFLGRMAELKRKQHRIAVRFMGTERTADFREKLKYIADYLNGKSLEDMTGTEVYNEVRRKVDEIVETRTRESQIYDELKKAFYMTVTDPNELAINKGQVLDLLREFTGLRMDVDSEKLLEELKLPESATYEEFKEAWADGPGRKLLSEEFYEPSLLVGQLIRYIYLHTNVIYELETSRPMALTPDDFATPADFDTALGPAFRNVMLKTFPNITFGPHIQIML